MEIIPHSAEPSVLHNYFSFHLDPVENEANVQMFSPGKKIMQAYKKRKRNIKGGCLALKKEASAP